MANVTRNAVEEGSESAKSIGVRAASSAPAAANGTVSAAGSFGDVTVSTVGGAVTGTISDVRVVVRAPFRDENQQQS